MKFKIEHGDFKVIRACCMSGNCIRCHAAFDKSKRKAVVQMDNLSEKTARLVAKNWATHGAKVVAQ